MQISILTFDFIFLQLSWEVVLTEVLYLNTKQMQEVLRAKYNSVVEIVFGQDEEFEPDSEEGVVAFFQGIDGEDSGDHIHYLEIRVLVIDFLERQNLDFYGCRIFTVYEGFGAAVLYKRR